MTINSWDISNADAKQWNVTPGFHSVKNESEWISGSPVPLLCKSTTDFKTIKVTLVIKTTGGRQSILGRCSEILSRLLEPAELVLDKFDHNFYGVLTKYSHDEKSMKNWHVLELEFDGYEYAKEEVVQTFSGVSDFVIANPGNIMTPIILQITPQIGSESIEISGICRDENTGADLPVVIRELTTGVPVVLDGTTGLFTEDGEMKDVDIWGLPALMPGNNTITVSDSRMDISVRFYPRFM